MAQEDCFGVLQFLYDAEGPNKYTTLCAEKDDPLSVRCVAIGLLSWLKCMHSTRRFRPLEVDVDKEVGADTRALLLGVPELSQIFAYQGGQVMFKDEVPDEVRRDLCRSADFLYQPMLIRKGTPSQFAIDKAGKTAATHLKGESGVD
jgi:hypothetical protein